MPKKAKTWSEKFETEPPHTVTLDKPFAGISAGGTLYISSPAELDALVRSIPKGSIRLLGDVRDELATKNGAEKTCPLTTGIFLRIVSERALEQLAVGEKIDEITPFWRIVDPKSDLAKKLSCGPDFITRQRAVELE